MKFINFNESKLKLNYDENFHYILFFSATALVSYSNYSLPEAESPGLWTVS
ncbi:MAG: hypothetical protein IPM38_14000 [Ignavibacteria bacterium]|nr:hypothetical protein [Ignavibacteria bacterium]